MDRSAEQPPPAPGRARSPARVRATDAAIAVVVGVLQVGGTFAASYGQPEAGRRFDVLAALLLVIGPVALLARRRHPEVVFAVTMAATAVYVLADHPMGPVWLAMIVALGTTIVEGRRRAAIAEMAVGYVVFLWGPWVVGTGDRPGLLVAMALAAWLTVLATGAELVRVRQERAAAAERSRRDEAARQVTEERLRIAREVHDVVAHTISVVNLQAGVALHLMDRKPDQARSALAAIKDASKEALVELRSVLGVLRQVDDDGGEGPDGTPRSPTAGLDRLAALVDQAASTGVAVAVDERGDRRPLPTAVDLAAFRIVQEALTNAARHAGPGPATVRLTWDDDALEVEVVDDGHAGRAGAGARNDLAALGSGRGLAGMRERAEAVGGSFAAGPRPGHGWRVHARLPTPPAAVAATVPAGPAPPDPAAGAPAPHPKDPPP